MKIGVLALQGAVQPHVDKFAELGIDTVLVRRAEHLTGLDGIVLPGGESSTMIKLLHLNELWRPLKEFTQKNPSWGICAGSILQASHVSNPEQDSLKVLDIDVERNSYGRQLESFITASMEASDDFPEGKDQEGVFIRAPRISKVGNDVRVMLSRDDTPVMVRSKLAMATCFHPELSPGNKIHKYFVGLVAQTL